MLQEKTQLVIVRKVGNSPGTYKCCFSTGFHIDIRTSKCCVIVNLVEHKRKKRMPIYQFISHNTNFTWVNMYVTFEFTRVSFVVQYIIYTLIQLKNNYFGLI